MPWDASAGQRDAGVTLIYERLRQLAPDFHPVMRWIGALATVSALEQTRDHRVVAGKDLRP